MFLSHPRNNLSMEKMTLRKFTHFSENGWKSRGGKSQRRAEKKQEDQRRERVRRKKTMQVAGARKGRKAAKHCVFPMICDSGGSKSRLAKAAGAEPFGQMRDEKLHGFWHEAHLQVKKLKTPHVRSTFGS